MTHLGKQVIVTWSSTNPTQEIPYNKVQSQVLVHVHNSDCLPLVGPLLRSLQEKHGSSLSRCAPAQIQQIWHSYLSKKLATTSLLRLPTIWFWIQKFSTIIKASTTLVSVRGDSSSSSLRGHGHVIYGLQPRGEEQHNRAQAVEECRPLSPCGGPGPIKCLRWHDSSPQKCP